MKVIKRNQLIILVMSFMLITAGYLNFTSNNNIETNEKIAEIGDATLVSTIPETEKSDVEEEVDNIIDTSKKEDNEEYMDTFSQDQYFIKSKLERDTMYSQLLETYQEIYNNINSTAEQKTEAMREISNISNLKNAIMIAENLITAKGLEDVVIFVNSSSVSVIIKAQELSSDQIAQIQNIVSRELNIGIETIHISIK